MNKYVLLWVLLVNLNGLISAQGFRASLNEDMTIQVDRLNAPLPESLFRDNSFNQLPGFPKAVLANPTFKNVRNLTLVDLNEDGVEDILMATNHSLFAFTVDSLLWEKQLLGVATYPPSAADLDGDGQLEIVQATGGNPDPGRVYLLDTDGNDWPGWPISFDDNWILTAPALADVDANDTMEILISERIFPAGKVHILNLDGSSFSENWPVSLDKTPAITLSIGDIDNDNERDIVSFSSESRYFFSLNGEPKADFPNTTYPAQRYSFQSPILVDLDNDQHLEVVGVAHGDAPQFFVLNSDGSFRNGWPKFVPGATWTFCSPTVVSINGEYRIFMSRRLGNSAGPMLYGWDADGNILDGFPISKVGGLEGLISVADVDNDDEFELVFGAHVIDTLGFGFIHAYEMDGSGEVEGFPIRPRGWTFLNGASIGDVNGDDMMDLAVLTYTQNFGAGTDSTYLNVYDLGVPYTPEKVPWATYKGNNTRNGLLSEDLVSTERSLSFQQSFQVEIWPNPTLDQSTVAINLPEKQQVEVELLTEDGKKNSNIHSGLLSTGRHEVAISLNNLPAGLYWINIRIGKQSGMFPLFKTE